MMLINRPCLCKLDSSSPGASPELASFVDMSAASCVESAKRIINIVCHGISNATPFTSIKLGPWWCITHYAVSAAAVLLLEMAFGSIHVHGEKRSSVLEAVHTIIQWLNWIAVRGYVGGVGRCCDELAELLGRINTPLASRPSVPVDGSFHQAQQQPADSGFLWKTQSEPQPHTGLESPGNFFPMTKFLHEAGSSGYYSSRSS